MKETNKLRSLMVGSISHDLRTPLNGVVILLRLIEKKFEGLPKPLIEEYVNPSLVNCDILMCLINNILDFTQEEFDKSPRMDYKKTDIRKEVQSISNSFKMRAQARSIDWICEIDRLIPMTFNTDSGRLKRILINLIGNSMKFTFKGFVKINVSLVKVLEKDAIKFSISDTGVGMSKED
jgi:signal transduction histidine kinase